MKHYVQWNLDRVFERIAECRSRLSSTSIVGDTPIAYIPPGNSVIRWFFDPHGALVRLVGVHQWGRQSAGSQQWRQQLRTHCPDYLRRTNPAGDYPLCRLCQLATQRDDWRLRMQKSVLIYGQLCETSYKKKYWQPRKTYVMVAPPRLGMAVTQTLEAWFTKEPEAVQAMVNPQISGPATRVIVKKEGRISVTITPYTAESYPGIELGEWYQPLEQCWLRPEFSLADYQALLGAVEAEGGQTQGWD